MVNLKRLLNLIFVCLLLSGVFARMNQVQAAEGETDHALERQATIVVAIVEHEWWLIRWSDNEPVCRVFVDHENWPTGEEIYNECGELIFIQWMNTPACTNISEDGIGTEGCDGLYLHYINGEPSEKTIIVDLPTPEVWLTMIGCEPTSPGNLCEELPSLLFVGEEPLPNEQIIAIHVSVGNQSYSCVGDTCEIPLRPTTFDGEVIEFWADSSYGDSSERFTALVRVIDSGVSPSPGGEGWYVDVLSSQWKGNLVASCAQIWQAFPPIGEPPTWLSTPDDPELLATDEPYSYLAGRLIANDLVDASECPGGGLLPNGYADTCGLEKAMPLVEEWQNLYDARIIEVAKDSSVPAQLIKNLFAQESQFWPGAFKDPYEYGLGQLTDNGAETILLWNSSFYDQYCPLVLDSGTCERGYIYLDEENQAILRGSLALQANADCPDCLTGIDLKYANFSVGLFAETLLANCEQVNQVMYNATGQIAGSVSSYEELWRFTVANYHIGPGCISYAMYNAWSAKVKMDWEHVSQYLTEPCEGVIPYVEAISGGP
jgi:hypothetical protein